MGVPKLLWFLRNRYRNIMKDARKHDFGPVDNCYVDMNSVIHNCVPNYERGNIYTPTTENICLRIGVYLEHLVDLVKPRNVLFLAIDGVCPRAKMSQQRSRRHIHHDDPLDIFDSNSISPGTEFMHQLEIELRQFVLNKLQSDPNWSHLEVYFSGRLTPDEGEHKIMSFIRQHQNSKDYNPNLRHCLCGLDSDLILLMMISHEYNFIWLREDSRNIKCDPVLNDFVVIYLPLLIELIEQDFKEAIDNMKFDYVMNRFFDDFVLLTFFVGNDFIPHLPYFNMDFKSLSDQIWEAYKEVLPLLDDYIVGVDGTINPGRLEMLISLLRKRDYQLYLGRETIYPMNDSFDDQFARIQLEQFSYDSDDFKDSEGASEMSEKSNLSPKRLPQHESDQQQMSEKYFFIERMDHYKLKFDTVVDEEWLSDLSKMYLITLQWIMSYYRCRCLSYRWFYPSYYAPYATDLGLLPSEEINFDMTDVPFSPFEHLMAVISLNQGYLLPEPLQDLVSMENSPLSKFFVETFETDCFQKTADYEKIAVIPMVEMPVVVEAINSRIHMLSDEDRERNQIMHFSLYMGKKCRKASSGNFCDLSNNITIIPIEWKSFSASSSNRVNLKSSFANNYTIPMLSRGNVKINPIFTHLGTFFEVKFDSGGSLPNLKKLINKHLSFDYPFFKEGKIVGVHSADFSEGSELSKSFDFVVKDITARYLFLENIHFDHTQLILDVSPLVGFGFNGDGHFRIIKKYDTSKIIQCPLETTLMKCIKHVPKLKIGDVFPPNSVVFLLTNESFGWKGVVEKHCDQNYLMVDVYKEFSPSPQPLLLEKEKLDESYVNLSDFASRIDIPHKMLNNLLGHQKVVIGNRLFVDIGINLKNNTKKSIVGYSILIDDYWLFSPKAVELVEIYKKQFPTIFDNWRKHCSYSISRAELLEGCGESETLEKIMDFLYSIKSNYVTLSGLEDFVDPDLFPLIGSNISEITYKDTKMKIKVNNLLPICDLVEEVLFPINFNMGHVDYKCLDRIFYVKKSLTVPFGSRGTVVWVSKDDTDSVGVLFDDFISQVNIKSKIMKVNTSEILPLKVTTDTRNKPDSYVPNVTSRSTRKIKTRDFLMKQVQENTRKNKGKAQESFSNTQPKHKKVPTVSEQSRNPQPIEKEFISNQSSINYIYLEFLCKEVFKQPPYVNITFEQGNYRTAVTVSNRIFQGNVFPSLIDALNDACMTAINSINHYINTNPICIITPPNMHSNMPPNMPPFVVYPPASYPHRIYPNRFPNPKHNFNPH